MDENIEQKKNYVQVCFRLIKNSYPNFFKEILSKNCQSIVIIFLKNKKKIKSFLSIKSCKLIKDFMKFSYIRGSTRESCEFFLCPSICTSSHSQLSFLNELSMWPLPFHFFPLHLLALLSIFTEPLPPPHSSFCVWCIAPLFFTVHKCSLN